MKSVKFSEKIVIHCAREQVFDFSQDYQKRLLWDTFLKKAELMQGAAKAEKGVKAWCVAKNGFAMETEYVSFNRPKATAVKLTQGPYMFRQFLGSWLFRETGVAQTEVTFLYSFQLRFPFSLLTGLIKNNLKTNVRKRLVDLKMNIERGRLSC